MLDRPIFVVGCGRSGTTLLGSAIAAHREVAYLNEPRDIWQAAIPQSDIWSPDSIARGGRIALDANDWTQQGENKLRALFEEAVTARAAARLCEKLPINAFRLGFIARVFADARYVYIERDGVDVALSIAKRIAAGGWLGAGGRKWRLLAELAETEPHMVGIARQCALPFHKGLLEWALSTAAARRFLAAPREAVAIRYAELLGEPEAVATRIEAGCGLPHSGAIAHFLRREARPADPRSYDALDDLARDMLARLAEMVAGFAAPS